MEMVIDKIGGSGPVYGSKKTETTARAENPSRPSDNVQISAEASRAADTSRIARMAKESPDTERSEKIKDIKQKLENGEYNTLSDALLSSVADKIASEFTERT
jgi:anti-sigma28 factor (negative regulator of flagellin synthesis)